MNSEQPAAPWKSPLGNKTTKEGLEVDKMCTRHVPMRKTRQRPKRNKSGALSIGDDLKTFQGRWTLPSRNYKSQYFHSSHLFFDTFRAGYECPLHICLEYFLYSLIILATLTSVEVRSFSAMGKKNTEN